MQELPIMSKINCHIKEVREVSDIKEVANLLSTGEWIAIFATESETNFLFLLGKIS